MASFTTSRVIAVPAQEAWDRWSNVLAWPEWLPTVSAVEPLTGRDLAVGSEFRIVQPRLQPRVWKVTELQPGHRFTWESRSAGLRLWATHVVKPRGLDECEVDLEFRFSGPVGVVLGLLFGTTTRKYIALEAESLRATAESRRAREEA